MSGIEIVIWFVLASLGLAFVVRAIKVYAKMIYEIAPLTIFTIALLLMAYYTSIHNVPNTERVEHNANHIEAIKD